MIWIGIDPGVSGAVAVIDGDTIMLHDVPAYRAKRGEKMNDGMMCELLKRFNNTVPHLLATFSPSRPLPEPAFCVLEDIYTKPGESNTSALTIGRHWGLWKGILSAYCIPHEIALPSVWKKEFRLILHDKRASRARAMELFPQMRGELAKRRPDFSEALLLAEYARRRHAGQVTK
jgi:crossover junction endodeoxyribonuclease RuvC